MQGLLWGSRAGIGGHIKEGCGQHYVQGLVLASLEHQGRLFEVDCPSSWGREKEIPKTLCVDPNKKEECSLGEFDEY